MTNTPGTITSTTSTDGLWQHLLIEGEEEQRVQKDLVETRLPLPSGKPDENASTKPTTEQ